MGTTTRDTCDAPDRPTGLVGRSTAAALLGVLLAGCGGAASAEDCLLTPEAVAEITDVEVDEFEFRTTPDESRLVCSYRGEANGRLYSTSTTVYLDAERGLREFEYVAEEGELLEPTEQGDRIAADRTTATMVVETADGTYLKANVLATGLAQPQLFAVGELTTTMLVRHRER